MTTFNIAIIGECMVELQKQEVGLKQSFGGDTLNTALYLSRLTHQHGVKTSYVTALGNDPFSADMLAKWQSENIDTSLVMQINDKQPGLYYIETDETGERSFHYWRNDAAAKFLFDQADSDNLIEKLMAYDAVYLSGITLAILTDNGRGKLFQFLADFKAKGGKVIFDNNYRPKLWATKEDATANYLKMLSLTDIALLTFDDDQDLYGDTTLEHCIERTSGAGVGEIVIKRGSDACLVVEQDSQEFVAPTPISNVVDTTAAGDSFSAGYLARRLTGGNALESAQSGHTVAGTVIQYQGAVIPAQHMPNLVLDK